MIFDKTKMVKNQELQIEALTTQVQSLKDINVITKDLLEIRNSEVKAMEVSNKIVIRSHLDVNSSVNRLLSAMAGTNNRPIFSHWTMLQESQSEHEKRGSIL